MGSSHVIEQWQTKVQADTDRWEKIRKKEVSSGYEGTYGEDTGVEHVLGQGGEETPQPEAVSGGDQGGGGKPVRSSRSGKRRSKSTGYE